MDVKRPSTLIRQRVTDKVDHNNLHWEVGIMTGLFCPAENRTIGI
jgi:hypothetical protein